MYSCVRFLPLSIMYLKSFIHVVLGLSKWISGKESACNTGSIGDTGSIPGLGKEESMATHSSILAWRIPWTEESGRLQFKILQRVGNDWNDLVHINVVMHVSSLFFFIAEWYSLYDYFSMGGFFSVSRVHEESCSEDSCIGLFINVFVALR